MIVKSGFGTSYRRKGKSHYLLADVALVGEAIMLAMRTAVEWNSRIISDKRE